MAKGLQRRAGRHLDRDSSTRPDHARVHGADAEHRRLGCAAPAPEHQNKVAPKATALVGKTTTKIETIRDRVTGKTERELQAEREALMEEVELLRESNAAVGRLQQKTAAEREATRAKADEEIALLKQNTPKELESTKAQAERPGRAW